MLLLMAHIRSGSTLLNHLLLSHPDLMSAGGAPGDLCVAGRPFGSTESAAIRRPASGPAAILASQAGGEISLEAATLEALRGAYERCWRTLDASCTT